MQSIDRQFDVINPVAPPLYGVAEYPVGSLVLAIRGLGIVSSLTSLSLTFDHTQLVITLAAVAPLPFLFLTFNHTISIFNGCMYI